MTDRSIDRRVVRTRSMLHQAAMSLIMKKGYEAVTIKEICNAANVGRSTFYAHYTSKEDLQRKGIGHLRTMLLARQSEALAARGKARDRSLAFSLLMFEHARDHIDHYRALVGGRGGALALDSIRRAISDLVREELFSAMSKETAESMPREFVVRYVVGAYMAVLIWWLDGGAKLPPQRIDAMFHRLAIEGILGR